MRSSAPGVVASPCVSLCRMDADTGWCLGCMRTLHEIAGWGALVGLAWFTVRIAPRISLGARRTVAVSAALLTLSVGVLHGAGPEVVAAWELRVGALGRAPLREALAAACVAGAAAMAWATSPAVRR